jgi:hypothetical protein
MIVFEADLLFPTLIVRHRLQLQSSMETLTSKRLKVPVSHRKEPPGKTRLGICQSMTDLSSPLTNRMESNTRSF